MSKIHQVDNKIKKLQQPKKINKNNKYIASNMINID